MTTSKLKFKKYYLLTLFFIFNILNVQASPTPAEIASVCGETSCDLIFKKMRKFAKNGSPHAQTVLSFLYRDGYGTKVNKSLSVTYMTRAAKKGFAFAQYNLGIMYRTGYLVVKDIKKGNKWIKKAADHGHRPAIEKLLESDLVSQQDREKYQEVVRTLVVSKGENVMTIYRNKMTLTDLVNQLSLAGYSRSRKTGSRIAGRGCGNDASPCALIMVNTPAGSLQFANMMNIFSAHKTALLQASRPQ